MRNQSIIIALVIATAIVAIILGSEFLQNMFWENFQNFAVVLPFAVGLWKYEKPALRYGMFFTGAIMTFLIYYTEQYITTSQLEVTFAGSVAYAIFVFVALVIFAWAIRRFSLSPLKTGLIGAFLSAIGGLVEWVYTPSSFAVNLTHTVAVTYAGFIVPYLVVQVTEKEMTFKRVLMISVVATWLMSFGIGLIDYV